MPTQCVFFIKGKDRRCRGDQYKGSQYCFNHRNQPDIPINTFWEACDRCNSEKALEFIRKDDFNFDEIHQSHLPLMMACKQSMSEVALELIRLHNYNLNVRDMNLRTLLHVACDNKLRNVAISLIKSGKADLGAKDRQGMTPLMIACVKMLTEIASLLLENPESDPMAVNNNGESAFRLSCDYINWDIPCEFIRRGYADFDSIAKGKTIFEVLAEVDNVVVLREMIKLNKLDFSYVDKTGGNLLKIAIDCEADDIFTELLNTNQLDPGHVDEDGNTLLIHAVENDQSAMALALIRTGKSNPGHIMRNGTTVLIHLIAGGENIIVSELLRTGESNPGYVDKDGDTALIVALDNNERHIALETIKTGQSNANHVNRERKTALILACENRYYDIITALIESGECNINYLNRRGQSVLEYCQLKKFPETVIQSVFEATTDPKILMKFLVTSDRGMALVFRQVNFDLLLKDIRSAEHACAICHTFCGNVYTHSCAAQFHNSCISIAVTQKYGTVITANRNLCPNCRGEIDLSSITADRNGRIMSTEEIARLDVTKYHKICRPCKKLFVAGTRGEVCMASEIVRTGDQQNVINDPEAMLPDICERCSTRTFECPNCGMGLEHNGGCRQFACCGYGADGCNSRGPTCDHKSTDFVRYCGNKWTLDDIYIRGNYYEESDHESDDYSDSDGSEAESEYLERRYRQRAQTQQRMYGIRPRPSMSPPRSRSPEKRRFDGAEIRSAIARSLEQVSPRSSESWHTVPDSPARGAGYARHLAAPVTSRVTEMEDDDSVPASTETDPDKVGKTN